MKKIIALLLMFILSLSSITFASQTNNQILLTGNIANSEYDIYASESLERHISSLVEQNLLDNKKYDISRGIQQFSYVDGKIIANEIYYYFIYDNNTIIGALGVYKNSDDSFSSTFTTSYAEKLNANIKSSKEKYAILSNNNSLYLVKNNKILIELENLYRPATRNDDLNNISYDINETSTLELSTLSKQGVMAALSTSSKFLDIRVVPQYSEPICWAGSMASVINYLRGTNYTAHQVAVSTNNGISGANASQTKNYYINTYRIVANLENSMNSASVASELNSGQPIQVFHYPSDMSTGHSLVLRGYSQFVGGDMTYSYMDPALATIRSIDIPISAQNNGSNVGILCSGQVMYWYQSVKDMQ